VEFVGKICPHELVAHFAQIAELSQNNSKSLLIEPMTNKIALQIRQEIRALGMREPWMTFSRWRAGSFSLEKPAK
jgi:hypothetical protein